MPKHDQTSEQIETETDRLLLEQAKAFIRDLRATARNAPYGKIISLADAFAVKQGREFARQALETIVQEQNDLLEKKTKHGSATAVATENISAIPSDKT
jgi:hypothetical protein